MASRSSVIVALAALFVFVAVSSSVVDAALPVKAGCAMNGKYNQVNTTGKGWVYVEQINATAANVSISFGKLRGVTMGHFHINPSKGVVTWLLFRTSNTGGKLLTGMDIEFAKTTFIMTPADLVGDLAGGADLTGFYAAITAGNIYVNVHTVAYPGGEIACLVKRNYRGRKP